MLFHSKKASLLRLLQGIPYSYTGRTENIMLIVNINPIYKS